MAEQPNPSPAPDSLDIVEFVMAIEEVLVKQRLSTGQRERLFRELEVFLTPLDPSERDRFIRELESRIANGEFGAEGGFDDDAFAALVRNRGPRNPRGQAGAAATPDEPFIE